MAELKTALTESEARLVAFHIEASSGLFGFTRQWTDIDATTVDALVTTLKTTKTVTNPLVDGQTHSGTFNVLGEPDSIVQDDRSVTIRQRLHLANDDGGTISQTWPNAGALTVSKFENLVIIEKYGLTDTALNTYLVASYASFAVGHVYSYSIALSGGLWNLRVNDRQCVAVSSTEAVSLKTTGSTVTRTVNRHQSTALGSVSAAIVGQRLQNTDTIDDFGRYTTQQETETVNDLSLSAYASVRTKEYYATRVVYKNATSVSALQVGEYGHVTYHKNDLGLYDGERVIMKYNTDGQSGLITWPDSTVGPYPVRVPKSYGTGYETKQRTVSVKYYSAASGTAAAAYINAGGPGSSLYLVNGLMWKAVKVTDA
jgi:hypothetical protein